MSFFFKSSKSKSPVDVVRSTKDAIQRLTSNQKGSEKAPEDLSRLILQIKLILTGDGETEPSPEIISALAQEVYNQDLLSLLIVNLQRFEFEVHHHLFIVNTLLRRQIGSRQPTVEYFSVREPLLATLVQGYESPDIALNCGMMIRECARYEPLAKLILNNQIFWNFFGYVESTTFDTASDAFATFKDLLVKHKEMVAQFLDSQYDEFFTRYTALLNSNNYVTKRQSLKLLGELLLDRANFSVMTRYIASADNLKLMMNLLRDKSRNIQFEAFHVFKVFVANPKKVKPVADILFKNRDKLLSYLSTFHAEKTDDDLFNEEKKFLIQQIGQMGKEQGGSPSQGSSDTATSSSSDVSQQQSRSN
ncbi:Mo25-like protein [Catenaria anguillulae PL171]|uniref:Mo25-like protein n=1 Tax=Catenaria anguillulae PL171 TaxID=765915 RepID=A0A1Y2HSK9_9FUNG|nr:Mo25-like protein [Catenaria anguillulae PL171]